MSELAGSALEISYYITIVNVQYFDNGSKNPSA
jgi:hypothetical protein